MVEQHRYLVGCQHGQPRHRDDAKCQGLGRGQLQRRHCHRQPAEPHRCQRVEQRRCEDARVASCSKQALLWHSCSLAWHGLNRGRLHKETQPKYTHQSLQLALHPPLTKYPRSTRRDNARQLSLDPDAPWHLHVGGAMHAGMSNYQQRVDAAPRAMCGALAATATRGALSKPSRSAPAIATPQPSHTDLPGRSPAAVASAGVSRAVT